MPTKSILPIGLDVPRPWHSPMSVLEDMSYGLCVVCTPVENEVTGLIVEPGKVVGLRQALSRAVEDQGLRNQLGAEAARIFVSNSMLRAIRI